MGTNQDTSLGGDGRAFPPTRWSMVLAAGDRRSPVYRRAMEDLCLHYWKPIYAYIRVERSMSNEEAKDLAQEFVCELIEGDLLERFAPERGTFRSYLRGAVRLFLLERHRTAGALKRGGGRRVLPLDDERMTEVLAGLVSPGGTPEEAFDRQWANSVIDLAVKDLEAEMVRAGKEKQFRIFERYELHPPTGEELSHARLAVEFGMKASDVNHALAACRRKLRERMIDRVRDGVGSESELKEELARLYPG